MPTADRPDDATPDDERFVADLARLVAAEPPPSLGLESRLVARTVRHRRDRGAAIELRVVVAAVVFSVIAAGADRPTLAAALAVAVAYAVWLVRDGIAPAANDG